MCHMTCFKLSTEYFENKIMTSPFQFTTFIKIYVQPLYMYIKNKYVFNVLRGQKEKNSYRVQVVKLISGLMY